MIDKTNIPQHVAIIMDGNGRWAKVRGLPRTAGHRCGMKRIEEIIKVASDLGIKILTIFAFSTENWRRPKKEVDMLMHSLNNFLKDKLKDLMKNNIRLMTIGRSSPLPKQLQGCIHRVEEITRHNTGLILNVALNYGSRQEIVDAVKRLVKEVKSGSFNIDNLDENNFSQFFYTEGIADPDLLIRTSGEQRISNFLLWQISYTELYFAKQYWPDFKRKDFRKAIREYQRRQRRFGKVD